ncbi:alginate export family protein [Rhodothalassium salexigens]|nr:alginate export family protein [Rhodothalassium salexigens]MBB4210420.1 hypothetical protein [Rhodothalassium salexigens DSM 2132]
MAADTAVSDQPWRLDRALATPDWLTLSGEHRLRYSTLVNQFRPGLSGRDEALSLRTLVRADVRVGPAWSLTAELQDSRAYLTGDQSSVNTSMVNAVEPIQAHLRYDGRDLFTAGDRLDLRFGRQTLDIGSRRLVARNRFRNAIQSFNGVSGHWRGAGGGEVRGFYFLPVRPRPSGFDAVSDNRVRFDREDFNLQFWGLWLHRPDLIAGIGVETYVYGLHERDQPGVYDSRDRQIYTPGLRLVRPPRPGAVDLDLETNLQLGHRHAGRSPLDTERLSVFAHAHHAAIGYTWATPWRPRLGLNLDIGSGDGDTGNGRHTRFDCLFGPRRTDFGPTGLYGLLGRENLISAGPRLSIQPTDRLSAHVIWRANWLEDRADAFARSGVRDPGGLSGRFAGHQVEARLRFWLLPGQVRLEAGAAVFANGRFLATAPNATGAGTPAYAYTDIRLLF